MKQIGNAKNGDTVTIDFAADGVAVGFNGETRAGGGSGLRQGIAEGLDRRQPGGCLTQKALLGS